MAEYKFEALTCFQFGMLQIYTLAPLETETLKTLRTSAGVAGPDNCKNTCSDAVFEKV